MKLAELKKLATNHNIRGRSKMNKAQLEKALSRVRHSRKPVKKKSRKPVKKKSVKPDDKYHVVACHGPTHKLVCEMGLGDSKSIKHQLEMRGISAKIVKVKKAKSVKKSVKRQSGKTVKSRKVVKKSRKVVKKSRKAVKKSRRKKARKSSRKSSRKYKKKFRMKKGNCFQDCQGGMCLLGGKKRFHNIYYTGKDKAKFCSPGIGVTDNEFTISDQGQIVDQSQCANPSKYARGHDCYDLKYEDLRKWNRSARPSTVDVVRRLTAENEHMRRKVARETRRVDKGVTDTTNKLLKKIAEHDITDTALKALEFQYEIGQSVFILQEADTKQKVYNDYFKAIMKRHGGSKLKGFLTEIFGSTVATELNKELLKLIPKFNKQVKALDKKQRGLKEELAALLK